MDPDGTAEIRRLLTETHTWAVVGLSTNTFRPAYGVARFLQGVGKRIVPVHPRAETVHGEVGYPTLADIPFDVDVVDVFVNSRRAGEIASAGYRSPVGIKSKAARSGAASEVVMARSVSRLSMRSRRASALSVRSSPSRRLITSVTGRKALCCV